METLNEQKQPVLDTKCCSKERTHTHTHTQKEAGGKEYGNREYHFSNLNTKRSNSFTGIILEFFVHISNSYYYFFIRRKTS